MEIGSNDSRRLSIHHDLTLDDTDNAVTEAQRKIDIVHRLHNRLMTIQDRMQHRLCLKLIDRRDRFVAKQG